MCASRILAMQPTQGTETPVRSEQLPTRICYVISAITTARAGTEGHLLRLIRNLDRQLFEPHLVVMQASQWTSQFHDTAVPLTVLGFRSFWRLRDWGYIRRLSSILRRLRPDVVELHFTDAHFAGALAARWSRVPVVVSCRRDLGHQYGLKEKLLHRVANPFVDCFLANSREVVQRACDIEGLTPERFEVIHNGIDLDRFDRESQQPVPSWYHQRTDGRATVILVANLRPVKNVSLFLRAAQRVMRQRPDVCFVVVGDGEQNVFLQDLAERLGIADRVIWTGSVACPAIYLRQAQIGCLTSDAEGFSNSLIEYMAAGLPVVATQVGGAAEAMVPGVTGYLVPTGDQDQLAGRLLQLLDDASSCRRLGLAGRKRIEQHFSLATQMQRYEGFYRRLAAARSSTTHGIAS